MPKVERVIKFGDLNNNLMLSSLEIRCDTKIVSYDFSSPPENVRLGILGGLSNEMYEKK